VALGSFHWVFSQVVQDTNNVQFAFESLLKELNPKLKEEERAKREKSGEKREQRERKSRKLKVK